MSATLTMVDVNKCATIGLEVTTVVVTLDTILTATSETAQVQLVHKSSSYLSLFLLLWFCCDVLLTTLISIKDHLAS